MGCCKSNLKMETFEASICGSSKRSRSNSSSSGSSSQSGDSSSQSGDSHNTHNSSGMGSTCSTSQRNRSIWSRNQTRPICDDFAEQPDKQLLNQELLDKSCGYYTCSSAASTPTKRQLRRTQDMECSDSIETPAVGNLEWEMFMMQHAQRIMPKTSSPIGMRRIASIEQNSRSYHKWRNYLQSTPAHMLHNVSHIPEAIAGHFCPTDFPAFTDLTEMESAAKRFKVDTGKDTSFMYTEAGTSARQLTHTISTEL